MNNNKTRECPFCKEEILETAVKCKYCLSFLMPEKPAHNGICPYCKETVNEKAIICKHCKSSLSNEVFFNKDQSCGCNESLSGIQNFKSLDPNAINQALGSRGCVTITTKSDGMIFNPDGSVTRVPAAVINTVTYCPGR